MTGDYIVFQEDFANWEWYTDKNTKISFFHLLLKCNHEPRAFRGMDVRCGQCISTVALLGEELEMTRQELRTSIRHLEYSGIIEVKTSKHWTLFTIKKWEKYHRKESDLMVLQGIPKSAEEVEEYVQRMNLNVDVFDFLQYYDQRKWRDRDGKIIQNWKKLIQKWHK